MTGKFGVGGDFLTRMVMCTRTPFFLTTRVGTEGRSQMGRCKELAISGATVGNDQPEHLHSFKSRSDLRQLLHDLVALYHSQLQLVLQQLRQVRMAIFLKVLH